MRPMRSVPPPIARALFADRSLTASWTEVAFVCSNRFIRSRSFRYARFIFAMAARILSREIGAS
jgi:hypothetical protein